MRIFRKIEFFWDNFKRSTKWFFRMWNNQDWDHDFLIEMMVYKMKDIRYQLEVKDKWFLDIRHQPDRFSVIENEYNIIDCLEGLDKAIEIGERILKSDYIQYTPEIQKWIDTHDILREKMPVNLNKIHSEIMDIAEMNEQKDRKDFFDVIRDNNQMWWS